MRITLQEFIKVFVLFFEHYSLVFLGLLMVETEQVEHCHELQDAPVLPRL